MNLKLKYKIVLLLLYLQIVINLIFLVDIKLKSNEDPLNIWIYITLDSIIKNFLTIYPILVLYKGLDIQRFFVLGNVTEIVIYLCNLIYPILIIINYTLPVSNNGEILITQSIISNICTVMYYFLLKNTLKRDYQLIQECIICLNSFEENNPKYRLNCGHLFHKECILEWGVKSEKCPICRESFIIQIN
jgi:hypothetical protein